MRAILSAVAVVLLVPGLIVSAGGGPGGPGGPGHPGGPGRPSPTATYQNPLDLAVGDQQAASCADPSVIHGQTTGDSDWYLYCTSDALTEQRDAAGALVTHRVATFRSSDLVHWTYVNDAFAANPAWMGDGGGLWAPDVVYAGGRYLLYYTASDTTLPGGGSAIGVATSSSPTGPWTDAGAPVVAPDDSPYTPGTRRWTFDPEVITAGGTTYLYYGSYLGGVSVRQLSADGLSSLPATQKQIAIDNRYEGSYIQQHDGWYYFMGSATNCCAGALTGYSVFAARSRSPLGPFTDRDGVSILDTRVGGTPVITQNGNRFVGTGHNTIVTDFAGQDWTIYHAVDRTDPSYAGEVGYTKRPALLDPLDWVNGWPTVRGGAGPSDERMPAPAAQPGQRAGYRAQVTVDPRPTRTLAGSTDFDGSALPRGWSWIRQPASATYSVSGGSFRWQTQAADLHPPTTPLASLLVTAAPRGDYLVDTRVSVDVPRTGDGKNYVQGGLVIYGSDGDYVKLASSSIFDTRQTEFGRQDSSQPAGAPTYGNGVVGPVGDATWLRIWRHTVEGQIAYTSFTSLDGRSWDRGGTWTADLGASPRIGLVSLGGDGFTSTFDSVRISSVTPAWGGHGPRP